jgi:hypothetical protein
VTDVIQLALLVLAVLLFDVYGAWLDERTLYEAELYDSRCKGQCMPLSTIKESE